MSCCDRCLRCCDRCLPQRRSGDTTEVIIIAKIIFDAGDENWRDVLQISFTEIEASLTNVSGPDFKATQKGNDVLEIKTDAQHMEATISQLAEHHMVAAVETESWLFPSSLQASEAVQSGSGASEHRIWDKGVLGDGEVRTRTPA